jgi:diguanylate cyclase (GGDEF)-like protein/PAS domain S-box-containing protein
LEYHDLEALLQLVVDLISQALPADRVTLFTIDAEKRAIRHFKKGGPGAARVVSINFDELWDGLTGWVLRNAAPALSPRDLPDPRETKAVQQRRRDTRCGDIIVVPIKLGEEILGTITAINEPQGAAFGAEHVDLMATMAIQVAMAIQTSGLVAKLTASGAALQSASERMSLAINAARMGVWEWDVPNKMLHGDAQAYRAYGLEPSAGPESLSFWQGRIHLDDRSRVESAMAQAIDSCNEFDQEFRIEWPTGAERYLKATAHVHRDASGEASRVVGVCFDVTDRKIAEMKLAWEAQRDKLTSLANRSFFMDRLQKAIARTASRRQAHYAVMFLDFDRFKLVNDTLGHEAGDELLRAIAARLTGSIRSVDRFKPQDDECGNVISRFGGDEFLILINDLAALSDIHIVSRRLLVALAAPYQLGGKDISSIASIGIAISNAGYASAEEVVRNADLAMYKAKRSGGGRAEVYEMLAATAKQDHGS